MVRWTFFGCFVFIPFLPQFFIVCFYLHRTGVGKVVVFHLGGFRFIFLLKVLIGLLSTRAVPGDGKLFKVGVSS